MHPSVTDATEVAGSLGADIEHGRLGWLNLAFGTVPLTPAQWAVCAAMASGVLWYSELRKLVVRARGPG